MSACDCCEFRLGNSPDPCEYSQGYCDRCGRCDVHCVCGKREPEFLPGEAVIVSTTAGELPGVVETRIEGGVFAVQVEGDFPRLVIVRWSLRPAADEPIIVPAG